ncbi:M67 family peptidase [Croceicoccus ponticola]|uniref:M67 family peptidase n=1 Tax=Croceicoccus ponticola TaxID=2217664 RepID=A0A437GWK7_9SPHN|nr:M67 family metallopeptidase [Croceicoccus ponticola]RVQ66498.1 M67 family peptidase [Croceicoccus ponticola]
MERQTTSWLHARLIAEAKAAHPHECCGLLLGRDGKVGEVRSCRNVHPEPARHFEIDPAALIAAHRAARAGGVEVIGYYHSHPVGLPEPSATDRAMAPGDGRLWAIVAGEAIGWWRNDKASISDGGFTRTCAPNSYGSGLSPERPLP